MAWRRVTIAPLCHSLFNSESVVKIICRVQGEGDPQHSIKNIFQNLVLILRFWVLPKMEAWATMAKEAGLPVAAGPAAAGGVINLYLAGNLCNNDIWHSAQSPT